MPKNFKKFGKTRAKTVQMSLDSFHFFIQIHNFPPELFNYLKHLRDEHIKEVS
jgi:hypothetical protein